MKPLHLVRLHNIPIFRQLQYEEALIRADDRNWCLINEGSEDTIVMGISGKVEEHIDFQHLSVPIVRRFSGGGTVLVDRDTCFISVICNHKDVPIAPFPKPILNWKGALYKSDHLPITIRENDFALGEKKFGGNAQYLTKSRWLHHTSLLWDYCPQKMEVLKIPPKMPAYRKQRDHKDFLCGLKDVFPSKNSLYDSVIKNLSQQFDVHDTPENELSSLISLPHRKATMLINF